MSFCNNIWDRRINIKNRPSVTMRLELVIGKVMDVHSVSIGQAIEMLAESPTLYQETLEILKKDYLDIEKN